MFYRSLQKALDTGVKLASVAITGPATWIVATELFADIDSPTLLFIMRFAAVFLIEGVMLSNWLLLEFDRNATPGIKARYGLTALAMYFSLLVIGWRHEGLTGIVFRVALLAALLGSGWDTYVYTWQKTIARADKDIALTGSVRRHARKLAEQDAKFQLDYEYDQRGKDRQLQQLISDEKRSLSQEQLRLAAQLEHKEALEKINLSTNHYSESISFRSRNTAPKVSGEQRIRKGSKKMNRDLRLELGRSILASNPKLTGPEFVEQLGAELRVRFGARTAISESTGYADFAVLRNEQKVPVGLGNGNGQH